MPRAQILTARTAARRQGSEKYFDLDRQPTVLESVIVKIYDLLMTEGTRAAVIEVENDVMQPMIEHAALLEVRVGPRYRQTAYQGIARLERNNFIEYIPHRDDVERFKITEPCQNLFQDLVNKLAQISAIYAGYSDAERHRYKCAFFRTKLRRNFKWNATRRELDIENRRIKFASKEHARICPIMGGRSNSIATEATEILEFDQPRSNIAGPSRMTEGSNNGDSMYVDDVPRVEPVASGSKPPMPQTPIRRSHTLDNPAAYPSPESLARQNPPAPLTPERTPSRSRSTSTVYMDMDNDDDEELSRKPTVLFNQNAPDPTVALNEQIKGLKAEIESQDAKHQERLGALQVESDARLAAQKTELDKQIADLKTCLDNHLRSAAENDRSWLAKFNALRWVFRLQSAAKGNVTTKFRQQEALLIDKINELEEERERQQCREREIREHAAKLEVEHRAEKEGHQTKIRELEEEIQRLRSENQSLHDHCEATTQMLNEQYQHMLAGVEFNRKMAALNR